MFRIICYYWIYSTDIPAIDIPTFFLDDMPPDLRVPQGGFGNIRTIPLNELESAA